MHGVDLDTPEPVVPFRLVDYIATLSAPRFAEVRAAMSRAIHC